MADQQALEQFSRWVSACDGNEKQEARTFIEKLIRAWGWEDSVEAGIRFEDPINRAGAGGGVGYADALIPGKVLIEMKSRGTHLGEHAGQLQRYWCNLAPKPIYAILCNFDEIWIYDYNQLWHEPIDALRTDNLASRYSSLAFLSKNDEKPLFRNNQIEITEKQAQSMGQLFYELKEQAKKTDAFSELQAQRFVLQCVLCMFAEDRAMLPDRQFSLALEVCKEKGESTYDVLAGLFTEMNTPGVTPGGRFKGTPYFNGGLFSEIARIELSRSQLDRLVECAREDWKAVRPSIFGNLFEASSDPEKRHRLGQHFTSEADIMKVVYPTIVEPWAARIDKESSKEGLYNLLVELLELRILDPACGSGNFLYLAYNSLKDIERMLIRKLEGVTDEEIREAREKLKKKGKKQRKLDSEGQFFLGWVSTNQFFGMDTDPFAVELARVTMMIARKMAHDRLGLTEQELPLDNLDKNIYQADALFDEWPEADAIIGNPPFLGGKHIRLNLGDEYADRIFRRFSDVKDSVDFCSYWFRLAHDKLSDTGRAGLVATNSVRHGKSRRASLEYIKDNGGYIHSAISSQPWSGEANVHVSIVNWCKQEPESYRLDDVVVPSISTALSDLANVSVACQLRANKGWCFQGVIPVGKGFNVSPSLAQEWLAENQRYAEVLKPFSMGSNLAKNPQGRPDRWIIDFGDKQLEEIEMYDKPYRQVVEMVRPERMQNREQVMREKWWRFKRTNATMRDALRPLDRFFAVPEVSKWAFFVACEKTWLCGNKNKVVASDDFYIFGLLTSSVHRQWMNAQKGTLKGDIAYTHDSCFETFPFPQTVTADQAEAIRQAMVELNEYRDGWMIENQKGITELYNRYYEELASKLAKLHKALDALVLKAYGFTAKDDILSKLLQLNQELAEREAKGEKVVGPWDPNRKPE